MEVWLAYLRFVDHPEVGKVRPVILLDAVPGGFVVLKVTTAAPRAPYRYCELQDWALEGLVRPSRAQTFPLFTLNATDLLNDEPIGYLTQRDRIAIRESLQGE